MDSAKANTVRGNAVLPPPNIPKKVLESNKNAPPVVAKPLPTASSELLDKKVKVDEKPKGKITIHVYNGKPYEAKFEGEITGAEINVAWRAMYKQYKLWKHNLLKQGGK